MTMTEESYNVYNAVLAVAYSLHEKTLSQIQFQPQANIDRTLLFPWQVMWNYLYFKFPNMTTEALKSLKLIMLDYFSIQ